MNVKIATDLYSECVMFGHIVITDIHGSIRVFMAQSLIFMTHVSVFIALSNSIHG